MLAKTLQLYQNAYSGLPKTVWFLAIIMLINRSGAMVIPFLSVYLTKELKFTVSEAGFILACFGVGSVLGAYLGGWLLNRWGQYRIQLLSLFINGLLLWLLMNLRSFWAISSCIFVTSMVADAFRPANFASIAYYSAPDVRPRAYALNRLAMNLGFAIGPLVGGVLAVYSYAWLFWADGLTCLLAAGAFWILLKPETAAERDERKSIDNQTVSSAYRDIWFWWFVGFTTLNAICFFQFFQTLPMFLKSQQQWSEFWIGFLLGLNGLIIVFLEMILVYQLQNYAHKIRLIGYGTLFVGLGFGLLNISDFWGMAWLTVTLATFGEMFTMPFMQVVVVERSNAHNRGQYSALYTMAYSVGHIFAPILGTQIIAHWGYPALWWAIMAGCGISCLGFRWLERTYEVKKEGIIA
jgi:predicted MFS family arabinose efflux permease